MKAETTFSLKDQLFNPEKTAYLASLLVGAYDAFDEQGFVDKVVAKLPELALKERADYMADCLRDELPDDYPTALGIILKALPPELDPARTDDDFGDFILAPFNQFVARYGCEREYLALSLEGLHQITRRFTAEGAIRYFINAFPEETMAFLRKCAQSDNYHVRRLASEGTRAKLPWAQKLTIHYSEPIPILDLLYADKTRYVTRSVANHLNDISKLDPELVLATLARWQGSGAQDEKEMAFICRHGLRTLVKQGNQGALDLLGFGDEPEITVREFVTSTPLVKIGEAFLFTLEIESHKAQNLLVDYVMDFATDGAKAGRKVFKLKQLSVAAGQISKIRKKHPMRLMTTRRLYEGEHRITLQVNGRIHGELTFELVA